jgi:hypothetical protein
METTTYKKQYKVIEVLEKELIVEDYVSKERYTVPKGLCNKVTRLNQCELITRYLRAYPKASTDEVLKETGLSNHIYVNKIRKQLLRG